jgi:hypothetical protein
MRRWLATDVLIVDEVSMLTPEFLEKLNYIATQVRRDSRPMGGIQVIFVGDFYQLPPVIKEGEISFVFESPLWNQIVQETVCLTQILRQDDPVFHKILDETRKGRISRHTFEILERLFHSSHSIPPHKKQSDEVFLCSDGKTESYCPQNKNKKKITPREQYPDSSCWTPNHIPYEWWYIV